MLKLVISFLGDNLNRYKKFLKRSDLKNLIANFDKQKNKCFKNKGQISLVFVNDLEIKALNKKWRNINKPTDVLSFSNICDDNFPSPNNQEIKTLGEIFISLDTASRQATDYNHSLQDEVNKLLVHGVLHIFGFDHETEKSFLEMNLLEKKIINAPN